MKESPRMHNFKMVKFCTSYNENNQELFQKNKKEPFPKPSYQIAMHL